MAFLYARHGGELQVNSSVANPQVKPKTAALPGACFVVVWQDSSGQGGDSSPTSIKAQIYNSSGDPVGAELLVNVTTSNSQLNPTVIPMADGFFVAWTDMSGTGGDSSASIKGQFFDSLGARLGGELLLNTDTSGNQSVPALTTLADGAFALTWASPGGAPSHPVSYRTQVFESDGTKRGVETLVANASNPATAPPPAIVGLAGGGYVIAWESNLYVHARIFGADGNPVGNAFKLSASVYGAEQYPALVATPDGGFVAAWAHWSGSGTDQNDIIARRYSASGQPTGDSFIVTAGTDGQEFAPAITAVGGGYVITWQDLSLVRPDWEINGQFYDSSFQRSGREFQVNTESEGHQLNPAVAVLADGRIVIAWEGLDSARSAGIKAQVLAPSPGPTDIALTADAVLENAVENFAIATLSASGAVNSAFTFSYVGDSAGGAFRIEGDKLVVADSGRLDAEISDSVTVTVRVTDESGHSYDEAITLDVVDSTAEVRYSAGPVRGLIGNAGDGVRLANGTVAVATAYDPPGGENNSGLVITILDATGNAIHEGITVPGADRIIFGPRVAAFADGGFVATWTRLGADSDMDILGQRFDDEGNPVGPVFDVNTDDGYTQQLPSVATLADGGFIVAWTAFSGVGAPVSSRGIQAQRFDSTGAKVGPQFLANSNIFNSQFSASVAALEDGGFVITWTDRSSDERSDIKAQVFDAAGAPVGHEIKVNADFGENSTPDVIGLAGGGFAIAWRNENPWGADTRLQIFDSAGNEIGGDIVIPHDPNVYHHMPLLERLPGGGFALAWGEQRTVGAPEPRESGKLLIFDDLGNRLSGELLVGIEGSQPDFVALESGDLLFLWTEGFTAGRRLLTLEHPVVANADSTVTPENSVVHGNVLANDFHQAGALLQVGAVNGSEANVGETITLASGATVQVNSNGNYTYNPNGRFNHLTGVTGAANSSARDSFTYTLTNGTSATVTVTVTGASSPGEHAFGTVGNDVMTGTPQADFFDMRQGGDDNVGGGGGDDIFYFGRTITGADVVNGGAGFDRLLIQGGGGLRFNVGVVGIETIKLLSGLDTAYGEVPRNLYAYPLTMVDQNVAAGQRLTIDGSDLRVRENLTVNGTAERDGSYTILGGRGIDTLTGGMGHDHFVFGNDGHWGSTDRVIGGSGTDELVLRGNYSVTFGANQITGVETLRLLSAKDAVYGPVGTNFSYNITTNDANVAAGVQMTVDAAPLRGSETLTFNGEAETNGTFRVFGGHLGDTISGGGGADIIQGNGGAEILRGNGGADIFRYVAATDSRTSASDQILDFTAGDRIDLSPMDAKSGAGNDSFTWIGGNAFSNQAGELRGTASGNVWTIQGDIDGNGVADFQVVVTVADNHALGAADFML